ncbi:MAG TPA: signal peptidase II [Aggregatilinea sp.]|uniref:signal peptidase II n=1 Tax=Aggregatilinea sp. TaxID=2806333 RepID=UPI002D026149|nr:signal peptidase II [Aggregatilinea sp.]HML20471.1 signal peptidase II [Aggregatilinea sp.]
MVDLHHDPVESAPAKRGAVGYWLLLALVVLLVIGLDQLTKRYVAAHLAPYDSWMPIKAIEPYFRFTHVHNTGAAFGIFPGGGGVFLAIALVVSTAIIYFYSHLIGPQILVRISLGMQMGGALGNVVDRLRQGYVIDFFHVEHWPVFNIADSAIVVGVILLAFEMWRLDRREQAAARAAAASAPAPESDPHPDTHPDKKSIYG